VALFRIAVPIVTLGLVIANTAIQWKIADTNAQRVIAACEEFRVANGRYPKTLDELVPGHLASIPRAKYCLDQMDSKFWYFRSSEGEDHPILWWSKQPFVKEIYNFRTKHWRCID